MPAEPSRDNTYVLDTESATEQVRILHQDRMITKCMGGPLRELEPTTIEQMHSIVHIVNIGILKSSSYSFCEFDNIFV